MSLEYFNISGLINFYFLYYMICYIYRLAIRIFNKNCINIYTAIWSILFIFTIIFMFVDLSILFLNISALVGILILKSILICSYRNRIKKENSKKGEKVKSKLCFCIDIILYTLKSILSPDFILADYLKSDLTDKESKGNIIKKFNYCNLFISFIGYIILVICSLYENRIYFYFILIRTVSRSFEIIFAFYNDVTEKPKEKTTNLKSYDRIRLAVRSYIELIFLFGLIYITIGIPSDNCSNGLILDEYGSLFRSFGTITFTEVKFIISGNKYIIDNAIKNLFIALEIISGMTLILFSLAKYIGDSSKEE